jgi:hypothetical protein
MNIWDSVHRSLDKASKEAGRIARAQRLRSQMEQVTRQISTQEGTLLHQVMNLFLSGQLTQTELLPLCHELISLQQQLSQAKSELQTLQSQGPLPPHLAPAIIPGQQEMHAPSVPTTPVTMAGEIAPAPGYQPFDATIPAIPPPPPPPGPDLQTLHSQETIMNTLSAAPAVDAFTVSTQDTIRMQEGTDAIQPHGKEHITPIGRKQQLERINKQYCPHCTIETLPGHSFCQNCGTALLSQENSYLPTAQSSGSIPFYQANQETVFSSPTSENNEPLDASSPLSGDEGTATSRCNVPPPPNALPIEKDGGQ